MTHFEVDFDLSPLNVIILNAGDPPSSNSIKQFLKEVLAIAKKIKNKDDSWLMKKQILDDILEEENNIIKIWYLYFQWTNYWHAHWFVLEMFSVKFVKQNVIRIPTDKEELKLKIKVTQLEKERTEMLICDYIRNSVQSS
ncbi:hypothetical protein GLOIN_2v1764231 [Rhizophagus clarus]|uniref:Uncharacterized protein n=1 Tax=Rhizophagus clarus TaxID=94130 RepID=A0A8H3LAT6_9GLOM|nr:hypothetical protein GLOIN_2v1764231 [Rhizophagus clarus]